MYSLKQTGQGLEVIWKDHSILKGIKPVVSMDDGNTCEPALKESKVNQGCDNLGGFSEYIYHYEDKGAELELKLKFKCYIDSLVVSVEAHRRVEIFTTIQTFKGVGGIKISIDSLGQIDGLMANYLYCDWWTRPYFSKSIDGIPSRTQSLLWNAGNLYHHLMPVCDKIYKSELAGNGKGMDILLSTYTEGYNNCKTISFILASGDEPFRLPQRIASVGLDMLGLGAYTRENRRYPEVLEYLGWCTWDAFYHDVNSKGVMEKADEFRRYGLPVKWFMVDDGWSEAKDKYLMSFKEDRSKFPEGLKDLAQRLKNEYKVKWVGVWHAFTGYWNGIHPESMLAKEMKEYLLKTNGGKLIPWPKGGKGFEFWNSWHRYLKSLGIDFVKVDNQSSLKNHTSHHMAVGEGAEGAHHALEASIGINFDNCVINCMGMATEEIWNRPISAVSRNSDDFYPNKENGFKEHALQNAYNSYYHGSFIWGDWDMWWTRHQSAVNNAVLRAVSGGPVYFSDKVGETEPDKLWPLILSDGRILRCDQPGLPTRDCLVNNPNDEDIPLKIWNRCRDAGVIAAFNINLAGNTVKGTISPSDIPGLEGERFVVYEYFTSRVHEMGRYDALDISLEDDGVALFIMQPLVRPYTVLGLVDKYVSPAALLDIYHLGEKTVMILKDGGVLGLAGKKAPSKVVVNGKEVVIEAKDGLYTVDCKGHRGRVLVEIM